MRHLPRIALAWAASAVILSACAPAAPALPSEVVAPVPAPAATSGDIHASVRVVPAATAELGFVISAPVKQVLVSEGQTVSAGQIIIVLDAPQLDFSLKAAEAACTSAERNEYIQSQGRRKWNGFKFVWVAGPPEQRQVARAQVLQAQAGLEAAQANLDQSVLRAPFDGTIVSITVRQGEIVQPGQVTAIIGDLEHLRIETTDLSERDIARVQLGQRVQIAIDAVGSDLAGTVAAIDPVSGRSADGDVIYKVTIELDAQPQHLLWGMTGEAKIATVS